MRGDRSGVRHSSFFVRSSLSGPLPFVAPRREEGAGDGESGPGCVRLVRIGKRDGKRRARSEGKGIGDWRLEISDWFGKFGSVGSGCSVSSGVQCDLSRVRSSSFVVRSQDPFLSSLRDERKGQGMESLLRAVFGWFGLFGSFGVAKRSLRSSKFVARSSLSGPLPFVAPRREEGAGDGESGPGCVRLCSGCSVSSDWEARSEGKGIGDWGLAISDW
jgi:hypothetical protein